MPRIFTLVFLFSLQFTFAQEADWSKIDDQLIQKINAAPSTYLPFYLILKDRLDVLAIKERFDQEGTSLQDRTYELVTGLQAKAKATQADLLQ